MKVRYWLTTALVALLIAACGAPTVQAVARVGDVVLSRQELDARVKRVQDGQAKQPQGQQAPALTPQDIEKNLVELFVQQNLVLNVAKQRNIALTDKEVDDQITEYRTRLTSDGTNLDEVVQNQLGFAGESSTEFRQFVSSVIVQQKLGETLVTTDTVRAEVEALVKAEAEKKVKEFHSAHILIGAGQPQSGTPPTDAEYAAALEKTNKALERLAQGEDFGALAKELSDDPGSKDKGGEYDWIPQGQFVPEYEKAVLEDLQPGEYTKTPVKTQFGYHIIKLLEPVRESPGIPPEQVPQVIDQQIAQQLEPRRAEAVQKLITDEREKAKKDGQLEEPTFTDPTAQPGGAPADGSAPAPATGQNAEPTVQP